jgi:hypothetical protein
MHQLVCCASHSALSRLHRIQSLCLSAPSLSTDRRFSKWGTLGSPTLPVVAGPLDRVPTVRTQLTTCRGILGTVAMFNRMWSVSAVMILSKPRLNDLVRDIQAVIFGTLLQGWAQGPGEPTPYGCQSYASTYFFYPFKSIHGSRPSICPFFPPAPHRPIAPNTCPTRLRQTGSPCIIACPSPLSSSVLDELSHADQYVLTCLFFFFFFNWPAPHRLCTQQGYLLPPYLAATNPPLQPT